MTHTETIKTDRGESMKDDKPMIVFTKYSPYMVINMKEVQNDSGKIYPLGRVASLCRCGASRMKPYCDGQHSKVGFSGEKSNDRVPDRLKEYKGTNITVIDNRGVCSHDGECTRNLPSVFRRHLRPWINPDGDNVQNIVETIEMCPSGALSYKIGFTRHQDQNRPPLITFQSGGPLYIQGGIVLIDDMDSKPESLEHYALCRCGASFNKPFCDGAHWNENFDGESMKEIDGSEDLSAPRFDE